MCPVCSRDARDEFVPLMVVPDDLQNLIHANAPDTHDFEAVCARCVRLFERAKEHILSDAAMNKDGSYVLSTPLRLDAVERFTGKNVTIAFLDSGFYPHVDLTNTRQSHSGVSEYDGERRRSSFAFQAGCFELARNDDFGRRGGQRQSVKRFLSRHRAGSERRAG